MIRIIKFIFFVALTIYSTQVFSQTHNYYSHLGEWIEDQSASMNFSSFVFMDADQSGTYSEGDYPLAGIYSSLHLNGDQLSTATSNQNGFSNYSASKKHSDVLIRTIGDYTFTIHPPPNWSITTQNASQLVKVLDLPGSFSGFIMKQTTTPVGLVPPLFVKGTASEDSRLTLSKTNDPSRTQTLQANAGEEFQFDLLSKGDYTLSLGNISRQFSVGNYPLNIGQFDSNISSPKALRTLTFDDISTGDLRKVPNGYGGIGWSNLNAIRNHFTSGSVGYTNGNISEDFIAYSSSGHPFYIYGQDGKSFNFHSMYVSVAWPDAEGETLIAEIWRGEKKVREDHIILSTFAPILYAPELSDITKIKFSTKHYWQLVVDNVTISE